MNADAIRKLQRAEQDEEYLCFKGRTPNYKSGRKKNDKGRGRRLREKRQGKGQEGEGGGNRAGEEEERERDWMRVNEG